MANERLKGLERLAPNGLRGRLRYELQTARRSQIPTSGIGVKVARALDKVVRGATAHLYSGMEPKGTAPVGAKNRHPRGFAGDFYFTGPTGKVITSPVAMHDIAMKMAADHKANIGYAADGTYMGPDRMHIDTMPLGVYGGGAQWGNTAKQWADNLNFARATGIGPTPTYDAPTPSSRASALADAERQAREVAARQQMANTMGSVGVTGVGNTAQYSAPVGKVSRAPLGPASLAPDRPMPSGPLAAGSLPADRLMPSGPVRPSIAAPVASPASLASAYGQLGQTLAQAGVNLAGTPTVSAIAPAAVPSVPAPAPAPVTPPVAPPVAVPAVRRVEQTIATPAVNARPSLTPGDVWGGQVGDAMATGGNMVSRSPTGALTVTNKFGAKTQFTPDGRSVGPNPFASATGRDILGRIAGAAIGNMALGPVGGLIGGAVGNRLATGQSILGQGLLNSMFGRFPSAPPQPDKAATKNAGGKSLPSNNSEAGMRSLSPGAARAISKGLGGLY